MSTAAATDSVRESMPPNAEATALDDIRKRERDVECEKAKLEAEKKAFDEERYGYSVHTQISSSGFFKILRVAVGPEYC